MNKHYPLTRNSLIWLESVLNERFGGSLKLERLGNSIVLAHKSLNGSVVFDKTLGCFYSNSGEFDSSFWDPEVEGWHSALGCPVPTPGLSKIDLPMIERGIDKYIVHYDLIGLIYWNLARIEEIESDKLDEFDRFSAKSSHAYKHNYLERPVVDEWLHILGQIILRLWPSVKLREHTFTLSLSHDVDEPSIYCFEPWAAIFRAMGGHLIKRGDLSAFFKAPLLKLISRKKFSTFDDYNQFDWLMKCSESVNVKSTFYFMAGRSDCARDGKYEIHDPRIVNLLRKIYRRGHRIGIHPSFNAYKNNEIIQHEIRSLKAVLAEEGIEQMDWRSRMHYLRWENPATLLALDAAGINIDSTLGYADRAGFRGGTCFSFNAFDAVTQSQKSIRIEPLIAMDCSVIEQKYMGYGVSDKAKAKLLTLKHCCERVRGNFSLLWHNSNLTSVAQKELYFSVISQRL
jgi:hypothetical protein